MRTQIKPRQHSHTPGVMNKPERYYADVLFARRHDGELVSFGFEQMAFTLVHNTPGGKNGTVFKPDFFIEFPGHIELHEVKEVSVSSKTGKKWSSAREDAILKLKMASELFPMFVWKLIEVNLKRGTVEEKPF